MPVLETKGSISTQGYGQGLATQATYIEDVFSTYLYTGTGSTQTITNGIDLAGKGGLVWTKRRDNVSDHKLIDSARGWTVGSGSGQASPVLKSNLANAEANNTTGTAGPYDITSVSTTGYVIGPDWNGNGNTNTATYVSWTFREQPKFFDIVTYTGDGNSSKTITHSLGSTPGSIIVKSISNASNWRVYHRSTGATQVTFLNATDAAATDINAWNNTAPTSTQFTVGADNNASGFTYVAYLFAHDAGGFGATGTDNVISCGSVVNTGNPQVTLGYEPQWVLFKSSTSANAWYIVDNMRGLPVGADQAVLLPNSSAAEVTNSNYININATGFTTNSSLLAGQTLIYIAIRRGPMNTPTSGTQVYNAIVRTGTNTTAIVSGVGFPPDLAIPDRRSSGDNGWWDKLRGTTKALWSNSTSAELTTTGGLTSFDQNGITFGTNWNGENSSGQSIVNWLFKRAAGFFDVVAFATTGSSNQRITHSLGTTPEYIFIKQRSGAGGDWFVWNKSFSSATSDFMYLNTTAAKATYANVWGLSGPTTTDFGIDCGSVASPSIGSNFIAYLFATCPGVSKVGSYTGNGSSQTINCGFTGGARFILIKRTDSTGDWYVWDSARGIVASNDPHLSLNTTAAEVTTDDSVDTDNSGFIVNQVAATNINVNAATYIYLAIA